MSRLVTTTCPKCGAHVPVEPGADRATCGYCQTVSILKTAPPAHAAATSTGAGWMLPVIVVSLLVLGCGVGGLIAAVVARADADWFVVGVMGGLLLGLLVQLAIRFSRGNDSYGS